MKKSKLILISFLQAIATFAYIFFVTQFITGLGQMMSNTSGDKFLQPVAFLLLFVISAAISGFLVLGKSATLYLDGLKKEAIELFGFTIAWLVIIAAIVFVILTR